jgi:hypothetical protein
LLVEPLNRLFGHTPIEELDKGKAAGAAGFAINRNNDLRRGTHGGEVRPKIRFGCSVGHVANEQTYGH